MQVLKFRPIFPFHVLHLGILSTKSRSQMGWPLRELCHKSMLQGEEISVTQNVIENESSTLSRWLCHASAV